MFQCLCPRTPIPGQAVGDADAEPIGAVGCFDCAVPSVGLFERGPRRSFFFTRHAPFIFFYEARAVLSAHADMCACVCIDMCTDMRWVARHTTPRGKPSAFEETLSPARTTPAQWTWPSAMPIWSRYAFFRPPSACSGVGKKKEKKALGLALLRPFEPVADRLQLPRAFDGVLQPSLMAI